MEEYDFESAFEIFLNLAKEYGATITPSKDGKGHITINGKDAEPKDFLSHFEFQNIDTLKSNVPLSCQHCSNHPSNGGSGVCWCVLGNATVY